MKDEARFWDKIARRYAANPVKNLPAYRATLARVREYLGAEDKVLEIGCGTGSTALTLADAAKHITATDISPGMIEIAREKLAKSSASNVAFEVAPVVDDAFARESFDAVLGFNILHLVEDLDAAVDRAHALLKPGGLYITKTPCLGEMSPLLRLAIPVMRFFGKAPGVVKVFTKAALERAIKGGGFEIVEARAFEGAPNNWFVVARRL